MRVLLGMPAGISGFRHGEFDAGQSVVSFHKRRTARFWQMPSSICFWLSQPYAARRRLCTMIAVSAAGVTPSIRAACPSVSGRALLSRSTISRDSPPIAP